MHKYQEEGWVVCRVFKKKMPSTQKEAEHEALCWYEEQVTFMPDLDTPRRMSPHLYHPNNYACKQELELQYTMHNDHAFLQLPNLESPTVHQQSNSNMVPNYQGLQETDQQLHERATFFNDNEQASDQVTDWRVLDKFVASQLSHDDGNNTNEGAAAASVSESMRLMVENEMKRQDTEEELAIITAPSNRPQIDLWK